MEPRVAIIGVGFAGFAPTTPGVSYKELMFEAARHAYADAGIDPRADVDSFVCASEDLEEGTSIFDEYVPDQLGAVQRPVQTVASDGLFALATGAMLVRTGIASVVAVEAHSKASDVVSHGRIDRFAMDPVLNRPLGVSALAVAGLEMRRFLHDRGLGAERCAEVAGRNKTAALGNPRASFAAEISSEDVLASAPLFEPLTALQAAESADGCVVIVLSSQERATGAAVWVDGIGWSQDAPSIESRDWSGAPAVARAGEMAYRQAGLGPEDVEVAEVDDTFAYKQLQHLEALGLSQPNGVRVNGSGGSLGEGHLHEANGLARVLACAERLRAGDARTAVAQSWRGVPSTSSAVAVLTTRDRT